MKKETKQCQWFKNSKKSKY